MRRELAEADYEAALDFAGLTKSALWPALAGIPLGRLYDADGRELARLFYNRKVKLTSTCRHVVERNLALARALDARETPGRVAFQVADEVKGSVDGWWEALGLSGRRVVVVSAGAGWESKRWPPESFGRLARLLSERLQMVPLVVWGPGEEELAEAVVAASEGVGRRAPATSIPAMLETLSRACLLVGGDTGPTHLAAYLGVPTIAPYGASDPIRNGPWGAASLVLTRDLPCRPCWKTVCPLVHRKCLNELSPEAEIDAMIGWWERLDETRQRH
ncbi:hypothetical protein HS125_19860 [bacterium]|nr:hypothetical protein [bacterium]